MHHPLLSMHNSDPISWNLTTTIGISLTWPAGHVSKMVPYSRSARSIESCAALCTLYGTMIVLARSQASLRYICKGAEPGGQQYASIQPMCSSR